MKVIEIEKFFLDFPKCLGESNEEDPLKRKPFYSLPVRKVICKSCLNSTNDFARGIAQKYQDGPILVIAEKQRAGHGRYGRKWISPSHVNILCSLILKPLPKSPYPFIYTAIGALSIAKAIGKLTKIKVLLKWPNDIMVNRKKVAGILTELFLEKGFAVIGFGVNVNFNSDIYPELKGRA